MNNLDKKIVNNIVLYAKCKANSFTFKIVLSAKNLRYSLPSYVLINIHYFINIPKLIARFSNKQSSKLTKDF